jgi:hypothetical protein
MKESALYQAYVRCRIMVAEHVSQAARIARKILLEIVYTCTRQEISSAGSNLCPGSHGSEFRSRNTQRG